MASLIDITCPECKKQMKAPETMQGKKIRCRGCGHTFAVAASSKKPSALDVDDDEANPYGVVNEQETVVRCPHCTHEMESKEAVICLHCGYNIQTRQRLGTKQVIETSGGEHFAWLLPGIMAVVGILVLIGFDLFYCLAFPKMVEKSEDYKWLSYGGIRVWIVILTFFVMAILGKFAYRRLIVNPTPPEIERDI